MSSQSGRTKTVKGDRGEDESAGGDTSGYQPQQERGKCDRSIRATIDRTSDHSRLIIDGSFDAELSCSAACGINAPPPVGDDAPAGKRKALRTGATV
jgi:hypothetical protein